MSHSQHHRVSPFLFVTGFITLTAGFSRGEDWPEFRGPTGSGHVSGPLPLEWGPTKNVVWKKPIPGIGWSSPSIVGGKIFLTTAEPGTVSVSEQSLRVLCLDADTGSALWNTEVIRQPAGAPKIHSKNSHASPTPLVRDGRVYVHFGHSGTACLDLDGKLLWTNTDVHYAPVHGNGGSPVLVGDKLIFSCDGGDTREVVALDAATGKLAWRTERHGPVDRKFSFSTPLVLGVNGRTEVVSPASNQVTAYDPNSGSEIWTVRYKGYSVIPKPVYGHGLVFVCTGYDTPSLLAIRPDGSGEVTDTHVAWKHTKAVPHSASLLLIGDELYMVSDGGIASCLDARTGKVRWQERLGGGFSASPIDAGGRIYFTNEAGVTFVVKAGTNYELLAKNDLGERTLSSLAAADGALYARTVANLYRLAAAAPAPGPGKARR